MIGMGAVVWGWVLCRGAGLSGWELARWIDLVVCGWVRCYGVFYCSVLCPFLACMSACLMRWLRDRRKRRWGLEKAVVQWQRVVRLRPRFFARWAWVTWIPSVWWPGQQERCDGRLLRTVL